MPFVLIFYWEFKFLYIPYCHRARKEYGILSSSYFSMRLLIWKIDLKLKSHLSPFLCPLQFFSCWSILYFRSLKFPAALWVAGLTVCSVGPWFCAYNRAKYSFREDAKLPPRVTQNRDGHFMDTHMDNQRPLYTHEGVCLKPIHSMASHALQAINKEESTSSCCLERTFQFLVLPCTHACQLWCCVLHPLSPSGSCASKLDSKKVS